MSEWSAARPSTECDLGYFGHCIAHTRGQRCGLRRLRSAYCRATHQRPTLHSNCTWRAHLETARSSSTRQALAGLVDHEGGDNVRAGLLQNLKVGWNPDRAWQRLMVVRVDDVVVLRHWKVLEIAIQRNFNGDRMPRSTTEMNGEKRNTD
eukprot:1315581-Rhodomonas_salina.1